MSLAETAVGGLREKLATYDAARRRGADFLLAHANADGSIGPVEKGTYYYRMPWALALAGETAAASRLLGWIEQRMLTPEGEVAGAASHDRGMSRGANTYAETCLAYGAHLLGRFDVARRAMDFALRYQDPETGGAWWDRSRTGPDDPQIVFTTAQLGMSAVLTGHLEAARLVGRFFERLWAAQPELPDRLYTIWARSGGLATRVPEGAERRHYVNEAQDERQFHYNGGIAAAFLTRLYLATGDARWLELARGYQRFSMESTERQFNVKQVCKSAWGGGLLAIATGEARYLAWAARLGDWFVAGQHGDGRWQNTDYVDPTHPLENNLAITAEFVVHLDTVIAAVGTALGRG